MRIYEDEIYYPPDMTEKPGSLLITGSNVRPGENCSLHTAPQEPVVETSDSDSELEELLRDTPEPGTPSIADSRVSFNSRSSLDN